MTIFAPSVRQGVQRPRLSSVPKYEYTSGVEACELCASVGINLDPWQQLFMRDCLGERPDGRWAAREAALLVARQNGKGELLLALGLAGLFLLNERLILHSAHEFKTAAEAFLRIKTVIDGSDDLRRQVKTMPTSHGNEGVELVDGRRLRFVARSKSSGRGFTGDRIIFDEAQELPQRAMRALGPTLRARPNPQMVFTGTVPGPENDAEHWQSLRDRGRAGGDPRLLWHEYSPEGAEDGQVDPDDRDAWYASNPALGIRVAEEDMAAERETFRSDPEGFARELMSVWPTGSFRGIFAPSLWDAGRVPGSRIEGAVSFAVEVAEDRSWAAIGAAGDGPNGSHVEVVDYRPGTGWLVDRMVEVAGRHVAANVIVQPNAPAGSLIAALTESGVRVVKASTQEYAQACGMFHDAVIGGHVRHLGQGELDFAVAGAVKKPSGDAFVWDRRKSSIDISPLTAVTLAAWGHKVHGAVDITEAVW